MARQMTSPVQQCIDMCNQCHDMSERMITHCMETGGDQMVRIGNMMISCADMCRMCADMLMRSSSMKSDRDMMRMCARMCELCADMCRMGSEMFQKAKDPRLTEAVDMMKRCADACRAVTEDAMTRSA
ncbi:hypothetical protein [Amycolatopsis taiwanensis]|uniref:hypothetical protein n=1 Tax=Amycolatopsis taiwanensis TaxID=342230 RepID=UPI000488A453|nr:hypothetical protein [Amycolatopsis taiwanensis]